MQCNRRDFLKISGAVVAVGVLGSEKSAVSVSSQQREMSRGFATRVSEIYEPDGEWSRWLVGGKKVMESRADDLVYSIVSAKGELLALVGTRDEIRPRVAELLADGRVSIPEPAKQWID